MKLVTLIYESIQAENMRFLMAMPMIRHVLPEWSGWNKQREVRYTKWKMRRSRKVSAHKNNDKFVFACIPPTPSAPPIFMTALCYKLPVVISDAN